MDLPSHHLTHSHSPSCINNPLPFLSNSCPPFFSLLYHGRTNQFVSFETPLIRIFRLSSPLTDQWLLTSSVIPVWDPKES
ncbi:hypothetical protein L1887_01142 [Cichorium endivia]|nr:hypothetical protein L1887_01142 [Cichorium endivia]